MLLIEQEASSFSKKVFDDFKKFRGEPTQPHSLVDDITELDGIEYVSPRIRTNAYEGLFMGLQIWGGHYGGGNMVPDKLDFHVDGDPSSGPMRTHYIASVCEDQTMGTRQVVGASRHHFDRRFDESGNLPDGSITGVVELVE